MRAAEAERREGRNCSGFYGDRFAAMREQLEGGPVDILTGDYLAELTMLILTRSETGTFIRQFDDVLGLALERGVNIVANAGGRDPARARNRLSRSAPGPASPTWKGDDLRERFPGALTANGYLLPGDRRGA